MLPSLLPRDPEAPIRTRQFIDKVGGILNSLILDDQVEQTAPETWTIVTDTSRNGYLLSRILMRL